MKSTEMRTFFILASLLLTGLAGSAFAQDRVKTAKGVVEGTADKSSGVRTFKGIPFAAPPVGDLRWQAPQPVKNWQGVRKADKFGPRCMQRPIYSDMKFRSNGVSEDCLYLNVWAPAKSGAEKLPVLVYFFPPPTSTSNGTARAPSLHATRTPPRRPRPSAPSESPCPCRRSGRGRMLESLGPAG